MGNKKIILIILFFNSYIFSLHIQDKINDTDEQIRLNSINQQNFGTISHLVNAIQINFKKELQRRKMFLSSEQLKQLTENEQQTFEQKKLGLFVSIGLEKITYKLLRISAKHCQQLLTSKHYQKDGKRNIHYVTLAKAMNNEIIKQAEVERSLQQISTDLKKLEEKKRCMENSYYYQLFLVNCFPLLCFGSAVCCLPCFL